MTATTTTQEDETSLTVSAPGKILLAGGYLVLESPNTGVVIGADKRFYCTATTRTTTATTSSNNDTTKIVVASPQFGQEWNYQWHPDTLTLAADAAHNVSENTFVEKTLRVSLLALWKPEMMATRHLHLAIRGDNDFYSLVPHLQARNLPVTWQGAQQLPKFLPVAKADGVILKTGLGSSACLVTSLVAALYYTLVTQDSEAVAAQQQTTIFRLAQICHCHAQGKVGSGFDVAAACYGSHLYQRFPKDTLATLLEQLDDNNNIATTRTLPASLQQCLYETEWRGGLQAPLHVPAFLQLMLADVSGGSESPGMARKVLAWKQTQQDDKGSKIPHWDDLAALNVQIGQVWQRLKKPPTLTDSELEALATSTADQWGHTVDFGVARLLHQLHAALAQTRTHFRAMGDAAGVPTEPPAQTALADATMQLPGVVAALVPGAGGHDALACLYVNTDAVRLAISQLWSDWTGSDGTRVCPLTVQAIGFGHGVRLEPNDNHNEGSS